MRRAPIGLVLVALIAPAATAGQTAHAKVTPRIEWRATGGFVSLDNRLVVYAGGRAVLTVRSQPRPEPTTTRRTLSRAAHRRLLRIVAAAHIERLPRRYVSATPVVDGIVQTLTFRGRKVTVEQESNPPRALERALDELTLLQNKLGA